MYLVEVCLPIKEGRQLLQSIDRVGIVAPRVLSPGRLIGGVFGGEVVVELGHVLKIVLWIVHTTLFVELNIIR